MPLIKISPGAKIKNSNIAGNAQLGGDTMIDNQGDIEDTNMENNIHIPVRQIGKKLWFEKPFGKVLIGLFVTIVGGGILYFLLALFTQPASTITNFEECAKVYPVGESYPAQCWTPDGKHFTETISIETIKTVNKSAP